MGSQASIDAIGGFLGQLPIWLFWPFFIIIVVFYALMMGGSDLLATRNKAYLGEKKDDRKRK